MMSSSLLFLALFGLFSGLGQAAELSPTLRLRKLSVHLRGKFPAPEEVRAMETAVAAGRIGEFLREKTTEYLATPQHIGKMVTRLDHLFRFKTAVGLPETRFLNPQMEPMQVPGNETINAADLLFAELAQKNASWDTLLTTGRYPLYSSGPGTFSTDRQFLSFVAPELSTQAKGFFDFTPGADDLRYAGTLTTGRYFGRYSTTNLNRNRGRAAAIFRIFLCDDMRAVVDAKPEDETDLLKKAFPPAPGPDGYHNRLGSNDEHGTQESCRACHYKLDPMGRVFITSGAFLSEDPAPGSLVYKRADGSLVDISGKGIRNLATALVAQPEYASCQVTHFWKWFIRADKLPSEARLATLTAEFNRLGRRTNDFISYLVNEPEFYVDDGVEIPTLLHAKPVLDRCNSCHSGVISVTIPSFTQYPIGSSETHLPWIAKIVSRLDLAHDGKNRTMPPKESAWQPTNDDILTVKGWIAGGARDEAGLASITESMALSLLELSEPLYPKPLPGFRHSFRRYLSSHDVFRVWHQKFPLSLTLSEDECRTLTTKNRAALGDPNPFSGDLVYERPSPTFIRWYGKCLLFWTDKELGQAYSTKAMKAFFGGEAVAALEASGQAAVIADAKAYQWQALPPGIPAKIIGHLVHTYIGARVLADEIGFVEKVRLIAEKSYRTLPVFEVFRKLIFLVGTQEEFLLY